MAILIGLWHRLIVWVCHSLFLLRGVARLDHRLGSKSHYTRDLCQGLCQGLVGPLCLRGLTWRVGLRLIQVVRSLLVAVSPPVLLSQEEKWGIGVSAPDVPEPSTSSSSSSSPSATFQVGMLFKFLINGEALHPTGLCLIWFGVTIFSLDPILPCSMTSGTLISRWPQLIILLFKRKLMSFLLREQYNPPQVVLVSILVCLWYLSILGAFNPYSTRSLLIVICTYLLLRCQLLTMYSSLSSRVIMPFPLIYRMLIYMFPLLSIIVVLTFCLV